MKIRGSWGICTTETFRWTSGKSPKGFGENLQTEPKQLRYTKLPPPGMVFGQPDLSQAEARIVAYLAGCQSLIDLFNDPSRSVHMEKAAQIWPGRVVVKDSPEYVLAKASRHAGNYRLGPFRFMQMTGLPIRETKRILAVDQKMYPEIHQWHDEVMRELITRGHLVNPFGEKRVFYEAISCRSVTGKITDQMWKDAIAWIPQSTVPHIISQAMIQLREDLEYLRFHHQGHDSMLVSFPPEKMVEVATRMKSNLEIPLIIKGRKLIIPADFQIGYNWGWMMPFKGKVISREEWQRWVDVKYTPEKKKRDILNGIYGPHLNEILEEAMMEERRAA